MSRELNEIDSPTGVLRLLPPALRADLYRVTGSFEPRALLYSLATERSLRFLTWFRLLQRARRPSAAWLLWRVLYERSSTRYGIVIPERTEVAAGLYIGYFGGIVVSDRASLGPNCNLHKGVTIGAVQSGGRAGAPRLGSGVWIGQNAVLVGGISVGDGAVIAPGAFVNFDVPPGRLVLGNPGRLTSGLAPIDYIQHPLPLGEAARGS